MLCSLAHTLTGTKVGASQEISDLDLKSNCVLLIFGQLYLGKYETWYSTSLSPVDIDLFCVRICEMQNFSCIGVTYSSNKEVCDLHYIKKTCAL